MIEEKIIIIPIKTEQIVQRSSDIVISMVYRFYDTEPNEDGKCDYIDVNIPGEGMDKYGWSIYKALSGAYKYAITQTFAIPTVDDAEKSKYTENTDIQQDEVESTSIFGNNSLNEDSIEEILGETSDEDIEKAFLLGK